MNELSSYNAHTTLCDLFLNTETVWIWFARADVWLMVRKRFLISTLCGVFFPLILYFFIYVFFSYSSSPFFARLSTAVLPASAVAVAVVAERLSECVSLSLVDTVLWALLLSYSLFPLIDKFNYIQYAVYYVPNSSLRIFFFFFIWILFFLSLFSLCLLINVFASGLCLLLFLW